MLDRLQRLLDRVLRRRAEHRSVELDVIQQLVLLFIARFKKVTENAVFDEVKVRRPYVDWPETFLALTKLRNEGLVQQEPANGASQRHYSLTKLGRDLAQRLPQEPRSVIEFYL